MAAARFSSDVLSEAIQKCQREKVAKKIRKRKENGWDEVHREMRTVVPEIIEKLEAREYIQKNLDGLFCDEIVKPSIELIANHHYKNIAAKKVGDMGWSDVHEELGDLPFCEKQGQITKVFKCECYECRDCEINGICILCYERNGKEFHRIFYKKGMELLNGNSFKLFVHEPLLKIPPPPSDYQLAIKNNWPFCILKTKLTEAIICLDNEKCPFSGCCFSCYKEKEILHKVYFRNWDVMSNPEYNRLTEKYYLRGGHWHEWYHCTKKRKFVLKANYGFCEALA